MTASPADLPDDRRGRSSPAGRVHRTVTPYAEAAYIHMGARRVAMRPSEVFKGRELPLLEVDL